MKTGGFRKDTIIIIYEKIEYKNLKAISRILLDMFNFTSEGAQLLGI